MKFRKWPSVGMTNIFDFEFEHRITFHVNQTVIPINYSEEKMLEHIRKIRKNKRFMFKTLDKHNQKPCPKKNKNHNRNGFINAIDRAMERLEHKIIEKLEIQCVGEKLVLRERTPHYVTMSIFVHIIAALKSDCWLVPFNFDRSIDVPQPKISFFVGFFFYFIHIILNGALTHSQTEQQNCISCCRAKASQRHAAHCTHTF